jgi:Uma2 family endonuclease
MTTTIEQYLNTSYHPDREFVDGLIVERNLGERTHSAAQRDVIVYFAARSAEYGIKVFPGVRVQVSPTRIRVPDVTVIKTSQFQEEIFKNPPHLCIEILSKDDTLDYMQEKIDDYLRFGVPYVVAVRSEWRHDLAVTSSASATSLDHQSSLAQRLCRHPGRHCRSRIRCTGNERSRDPRARRRASRRRLRYSTNAVGSRNRVP